MGRRDWFAEMHFRDGVDSYAAGASLDDCVSSNKDGAAYWWRQGWISACSQDQDAADHNFYEDDF